MIWMIMQCEPIQAIFRFSMLCLEFCPRLLKLFSKIIKENFSCQYIDEDGDVANEFLTEETDGKKSSLRKVVKNITPKVELLIYYVLLVK